MEREKKPQFPETVGSKAAAKARKLSNGLCDERRDEHYNKAMVIIHGGRGKKTVSAGR